MDGILRGHRQHIVKELPTQPAPWELCVNPSSKLPRPVIGLMLSVLGNLLAASGVAAPLQKAEPSRYPYCNVYTVTACFGISAGDELRMSMPIDFTIYDLKLPNAVKARIYFGYNPERAIFESAKPCEPHGDASQCGYVTTSSSWDVLYAGEGNQPFIHVHIEGSGDDAKRTVHDFLGNFRPAWRRALV